MYSVGKFRYRYRTVTRLSRTVRRTVRAIEPPHLCRVKREFLLSHWQELTPFNSSPAFLRGETTLPVSFAAARALSFNSDPAETRGETALQTVQTTCLCFSYIPTFYANLFRAPDQARFAKSHTNDLTDLFHPIAHKVQRHFKQPATQPRYVLPHRTVRNRQRYRPAPGPIVKPQ